MSAWLITPPTASNATHAARARRTRAGRAVGWALVLAVAGALLAWRWQAPRATEPAAPQGLAAVAVPESAASRPQPASPSGAVPASAPDPARPIDPPLTPEALLAELEALATPRGVALQGAQVQPPEAGAPGAWRMELQLRGSYPATKGLMQTLGARHSGLRWHTAQWQRAAPEAAAAAGSAPEPGLRVQWRLSWTPAAAPAAR